MEIIIQSILAVLFIISASLAEGIEYRERYIATSPLEQRRLNKLWHQFQFLERVFAILLGYTVGLFMGWSILSAKFIFLVAVSFWIIYDLTINAFAKRNLFHISKLTTSWLERFSWLKPILLIVAIMLLFVGCGGSRHIERIKIDTIKVASPVVEETLSANKTTDTVIIANKIIHQDTVINVKYYPLEKKFYVKVKPDTVTIIKTDTVTQININENKSFSINLFPIIALAAIGFIIVYILRIK